MRYNTTRAITYKLKHLQMLGYYYSVVLHQVHNQQNDQSFQNGTFLFVCLKPFFISEYRPSTLFSVSFANDQTLLILAFTFPHSSVIT
uniref:Uncharacterized protein n=1 Tax=Arundo donax TaxID=35708 RepID=A0A0A9CWI3_ARUDO